MNVAVGLDGRAFRDLPYPPGTTIFEIDRSEVRARQRDKTSEPSTTTPRRPFRAQQVLDFKACQLEKHPEIQPVCRRVAIATDVVADPAWEEALVAQGACVH